MTPTMKHVTKLSPEEAAATITRLCRENTALRARLAAVLALENCTCPCECDGDGYDVRVRAAANGEQE